MEDFGAIRLLRRQRFAIKASPVETTLRPHMNAPDSSIASQHLVIRAADTRSLSAASRYCRRLAHRHYENFLVGSLLLPRSVRPHFYHVYAFCRIADDLADESGDAALALNRLAKWRLYLHDCLSAPSEHPVFLALADTIRQFNLRLEPFDRLLDAFEQDQRQGCYPSFAELLEYCNRSANPVGEIVLGIGGVDNREALPLSDSVCTGLQLVNHWQDIAADLGRGRVYLPQEDLERFGIDPQLSDAREKHLDFKRLLRFEVDRAKQFLVEGRPLVGMVPPWLAADVQLFIEGGLAAAAAIERVEYDIWRGRPRVSRLRQCRLAAATLRTRLGIQR